MKHSSYFFLLLMILAGNLAGQESSMDTPMTGSDYPFPVDTVTLDNGLELAYSEYGSGDQTVVMIHGLGSYGPAWQKMVVHLQDDFRCITVDLPGYGQSEVGERPYSMSYFARTIAELIDALELESVILAGHSMGAQIAMTCVLETEAPVERLILLAPAGFETFTAEEATGMMAFVTPEGLFATSEEDLKPRFAINFAGNELPEDAVFMYEDRLALKRDSAAYMTYCEGYAQSVQAMLDGPVFQRMPSIYIPVLTFFGEQDLLIPNRYLHPDLTTQAVGEAGTKQLPQGELQMIPDCGHFVLWDQAEMVSEAIKRWLQP